MPKRSWRGFRARTMPVTLQLGLVMMELFSWRWSGLTSGMRSGTWGSIRLAREQLITVLPEEAWSCSIS